MPPELQLDSDVGCAGLAVLRGGVAPCSVWPFRSGLQLIRSRAPRLLPLVRTLGTAGIVVPCPPVLQQVSNLDIPTLGSSQPSQVCTSLAPGLHERWLFGLPLTPDASLTVSYLF